MAQPRGTCSCLHSSKPCTTFLLLYILHVKQAATNTPASCVKKRIYSARTQYSIATKAVVSLKNRGTPNFQNNHQSFQTSPHPTALILILPPRTRQPVTPAPRIPAWQGTEGGPAAAPSSSRGAWDAPNGEKPGQQFAPVQLFGTPPFPPTKGNRKEGRLWLQPTACAREERGSHQ